MFLQRAQKTCYRTFTKVGLGDRIDHYTITTFRVGKQQTCFLLLHGRWFNNPVMILADEATWQKH